MPNNPGPHYSQHVNKALRVCNSATLVAIAAGIIDTSQEAERFQWQCLFDNKATL